MQRYILNAFLLSLIVFRSASAQQHPVLHPEDYRTGYDIPAGVLHGTWDFDEWPGVDHSVEYTEPFRYNSSPGEKNKIDYAKTVFDADDYEGYLKSPAALRQHGFQDMRSVLTQSGTSHTLIGFFTHPDDEILLAGGLLAEAAHLGWNVTVYLFSNGADGLKGNSEAPDTELRGYNAFGVFPDGSIHIATDNNGLVKERIAHAYADTLGIEIRIIPFDLELEGKRIVQFGEMPGLDYEKTFGKGSIARSAMEEKCREILQKVHPDIVVTHGANGEYGSIYHKAVHDVTLHSVQQVSPSAMLFTGFPEYNESDYITHYLDLDADNAWARAKKYAAFRAITFLHSPSMDYDKPWNPEDDLMDGAFVKDYGYSPIEGYPPRYEFYQIISFDDESF